MNYPEYRRQGLPVTSSLVESLIKEFNLRVKGTEKFWNRPEHVESILQVRAALLSDDDRLSKHLRRRPGSPYTRPRDPKKQVLYLKLQKRLCTLRALCSALPSNTRVRHTDH
jgi:hypothetical protein